MSASHYHAAHIQSEGAHVTVSSEGKALNLVRCKTGNIFKPPDAKIIKLWVREQSIESTRLQGNELAKELET